MITKVLIHQNEIHIDSGGVKSDAELATYDITNLLLDNDYVINYRTEFKNMIEQIPSDIELAFDNDFIEGQNFSLYDFMKETIANSNKYLSISIFIDNRNIAEFWGAVDYTSIYYDRDNDIIRFNTIDFINKYKEIWSERDLPNIWNAYNSRAKINDILDLVIQNSQLLTGYNCFVGDLADKWIDMNVHIALSNSADEKPYTIAEFLEILKKKFVAYMFISGDRKLNFVSYKTAINDANFDQDNIIRVEEFNFPNDLIEGVVVSYSFTPDEPYPAWQPNRMYYVNDEVTYLDSIYRCIEEHESTNDNKPPNYLWQFIRITDGIRYPDNFFTYLPFCLFIKYDGSAFALPYYFNATATDWGEAIIDLEELVSKFLPIHKKRYLDVRPDVRVKKTSATDLQLLAKNVLYDVTKEEYFNLYREFLTGRYFERVVVDYDGYDFNLMQRINFLGKNFLITEIKKDLEKEVSTLILREMYE